MVRTRRMRRRRRTRRARPGELLRVLDVFDTVLILADTSSFACPALPHAHGHTCCTVPRYVVWIALSLASPLSSPLFCVPSPLCSATLWLPQVCIQPSLVLALASPVLGINLAARQTSSRRPCPSAGRSPSFSPSRPAPFIAVRRR